MKAPFNFKIETHIPATPLQIFEAWHSIQTLESGTVTKAQRTSHELSTAFVAWDSHVSGIHALVEKLSCLVQQWKPPEGDRDNENCLFTVRLHAHAHGTKMVLTQQSLARQANGHKQQGADHYFEPRKTALGRQ